MRQYSDRKIERLHTTESPDYLRGYRDGMREGRAYARHSSADGLLGALLAIAIIAGIGYLGYNYANTGRWLPEGTNLNVPAPANDLQP